MDRHPRDRSPVGADPARNAVHRYILMAIVPFSKIFVQLTRLYNTKL